MVGGGAEAASSLLRPSALRALVCGLAGRSWRWPMASLVPGLGGGTSLRSCAGLVGARWLRLVRGWALAHCFARARAWWGHIASLVRGVAAHRFARAGG